MGDAKKHMMYHIYAYHVYYMHDLFLMAKRTFLICIYAYGSIDDVCYLCVDGCNACCRCML